MKNVRSSSSTLTKCRQKLAMKGCCGKPCPCFHEKLPCRIFGYSLAIFLLVFLIILTVYAIELLQLLTCLRAKDDSDKCYKIDVLQFQDMCNEKGLPLELRMSLTSPSSVAVGLGDVSVQLSKVDGSSLLDVNAETSIVGEPTTGAAWIRENPPSRSTL